jgi:hypothetical protein
MELLRDYWLQAREDWSNAATEKTHEHILLNIKKAIDLASNKGTLYIKLSYSQDNVENPAPPYTDAAGDLVLPTYFCDVYALVAVLKRSEAFKSLRVEALSNQQYVRVQL